MWKLDRLLTCKSVDQAQQEKDPASLKKHDCLISSSSSLLAFLFRGASSWPFLAMFFFVSIAWQYLSRCFQKSGYFAPVFGHFFFLQQKNTFAPPTTQKEQNSVQLQSSVGISSIQDTQLFFRSTLLALSQKKLKELADVFTFWVDQFFFTVYFSLMYLLMILLPEKEKKKMITRKFQNQSLCQFST